MLPWEVCLPAGFLSLPEKTEGGTSKKRICGDASSPQGKIKWIATRRSCQGMSPVNHRQKLSVKRLKPRCECPHDNWHWLVLYYYCMGERCSHITSGAKSPRLLRRSSCLSLLNASANIEDPPLPRNKEMAYSNGKLLSRWCSCDVVGSAEATIPMKSAITNTGCCSLYAWVQVKLLVQPNLRPCSHIASWWSYAPFLFGLLPSPPSPYYILTIFFLSFALPSLPAGTGFRPFPGADSNGQVGIKVRISIEQGWWRQRLQ